jgi:hypothetical protein
MQMADDDDFRFTVRSAVKEKPEQKQLATIARNIVRTIRRHD